MGLRMGETRKLARVPRPRWGKNGYQNKRGGGRPEANVNPWLEKGFGTMK